MATEMMYIISSKGGTRLAVLPTMQDARDYIADGNLDAHDLLYIDEVPEDEDLYYSINR